MPSSEDLHPRRGVLTQTPGKGPGAPQDAGGPRRGGKKRKAPQDARTSSRPETPGQTDATTERRWCKVEGCRKWRRNSNFCTKHFNEWKKKVGEEAVGGGAPPAPSSDAGVTDAPQDAGGPGGGAERRTAPPPEGVIHESKTDVLLERAPPQDVPREAGGPRQEVKRQKASPPTRDHRKNVENNASEADLPRQRACDEKREEQPSRDAPRNDPKDDVLGVPLMSPPSAAFDAPPERDAPQDASGPKRIVVVGAPLKSPPSAAFDAPLSRDAVGPKPGGEGGEAPSSRGAPKDGSKGRDNPLTSRLWGQSPFCHAAGCDEWVSRGGLCKRHFAELEVRSVGVLTKGAQSRDAPRDDGHPRRGDGRRGAPAGGGPKRGLAKRRAPPQDAPKDDSVGANCPSTQNKSRKRRCRVEGCDRSGWRKGGFCQQHFNENVNKSAPSHAADEQDAPQDVDGPRRDAKRRKASPQPDNSKKGKINTSKDGMPQETAQCEWQKVQQALATSVAATMPRPRVLPQDAGEPKRGSEAGKARVAPRDNSTGGPTQTLEKRRSAPEEEAGGSKLDGAKRGTTRAWMRLG